MSNPYPTGFQNENPEAPPASDRGLFDCFGKKDEQPQEDVPMTETEHKPSLMEKLHRSNGSSSSSSEEEVEEGGVKIRRRKKKGLTDKIKEKLPGHKNEGAAVVKEGDHNHHHAAAANVDGMHPDEKKGFLEKIKEKLPGHHKDDPGHAAVTPAPAHVHAPAPAHAPAHAPAYAPAAAGLQCGVDGHCGVQGAHEPHEKKGIFEKIKEKLPGGHKDDDEAKKDHQISGP